MKRHIRQSLQVQHNIPRSGVRSELPVKSYQTCQLNRKGRARALNQQLRWVNLKDPQDGPGLVEVLPVLGLLEEPRDAGIKCAF